MSEYFEGIYYKHQKNGRTVCIIPGRTKRSAFIQVITNEKSYVYHFPSLKDSHCTFCKNGIQIALPDVRGAIHYSDMTPIKYDIMGPFRFFPLECKHKVISMHHKLSGTLSIEGETIDFTDGTGYIEGDKGHSFPKKYLWIQCSDFKGFLGKCSIMISVAHIPFFLAPFWGCIAVAYYKGREYRFATYLGVKIITAVKNKVILKQGRYRLEADIKSDTFYALASPKNGKMTNTVYESNTAKATFKLFEGDSLLFELSSGNVSFEYENMR